LPFTALALLDRSGIDFVVIANVNVGDGSLDRGSKGNAVKRNLSSGICLPEDLASMPWLPPQL
jgi:hypothetical protein